MRFDIKRHFSTRSERVKCVDMHDHEPWFLVSLYNGQVIVYNYETQNVVKTIEVAENTPIRAARFVSRKQWIVCGGDDYQLRVYNYDTTERVKQIDAHQDYIRSIAVHPSQPFVLSASDDMSIKLWDWEKNWTNTRVFEGHSHYVMQVVFNPKDPNTFASASLDKTIKVWGLGASTPHFTLEGHSKGVNCVEYFRGGDKPYLLSGADDHTAKVWDYSSKSCVQTLEGHTHNVSAVLFHPDLPTIITGAEDNTVKVWHSTTYQLQTTLNYGMERCWALASLKGTNMVLMGFDEGCVMTKIGRDEPPVSMDRNGKVIWARQADIQTANLKAVEEAVDGEALLVKSRDLESCQIYPQRLAHSPNGRFVTVCGDGEYIIYTPNGWRNTTYGYAHEFVWAADSKEFAVRDASGRVAVMDIKEKSKKEKTSYRAAYTPEGLFGGQLLAIRGPDFVEFREWGELRLVRTIEMAPQLVLWSDNGELVAVCGEGVVYVLRYNREQAEAVLESGVAVPADGIESAFEVVCDVADSVKTACWVGECLIYTTATSRLHYMVGGEVMVLHHLDTPMYMLGYLPKENRVYLMDREFNVYSYTLLLAMLEFQTQVTQGRVQNALAILPSIPKEHHNKCARFLETKGFKDLALEVSQDPEHRFELSVALGRLDVAHEIASATNAPLQWKQLADLALSQSRMDLAMECMVRSDDLGGLLLLLTAMGDRESLARLGQRGCELGKNNIAFVCFLLNGDLGKCVDVLVQSKRLPEAAFFCSTYCPGRVTEVVDLWKANLAVSNPKAAEALASPDQYPNLFPGYMEALEREKQLQVLLQNVLPADAYPAVANEGVLAVLAAASSGAVAARPQSHQGGEQQAEQPQAQPQQQEQEEVGQQPPPQEEPEPELQAEAVEPEIDGDDIDGMLGDIDLGEEVDVNAVLQELEN